MTMTVPTAAVRIGRELGVAHTTIDEAIVSVAALMHSTAMARVHISDADPALGQVAMLRMNKSFGELLSVRADMLRAHEALKADLRVVSGAEEPTCPDRYFTTASSETATAAA